jgi:hypothetical protein
MNSEEVIINLKVLESLEKNQKLISRGSYLNIEPISIIPEAIRRWNRQDNRHETLKKINLIVNSAIDIIKSKNNNNKTKVQLDIQKYLQKSLYGIENLKETYATCFQTCARLDVIIDKIKTTLNIKENVNEYLNDNNDNNNNDNNNNDNNEINIDEI